MRFSISLTILADFLSIEPRYLNESDPTMRLHWPQAGDDRLGFSNRRLKLFSLFSHPLSDDLAPQENVREFDSGRLWRVASHAL